MLATVQQFFQSILPSDGVFVTAHMVEGRIKQKVHNSHTGVIDFCVLNHTKGIDCWFAVSSYKQGWHEVETPNGVKAKLRTQNNVLQAKALWLDIDVGDNKAYKTREDALNALNAFVDKLKLPTPYVVGSGKLGLHVYFVLTKAVSKGDWQYLADRLHSALHEHNVYVDPMRTRDAASILRCPMTWNMKGVEAGGQPHQVTILSQGSSAPFEELKQILDNYQPSVTHHTPSLPVLDIGAVDVPSIEISAELRQTIFSYFQPIKIEYETRDAVEVIAGCEQLRLMDSGKEPSWRACLSVLRFCERGVAAAHVLSKSDKWRTEYNIEEKLQWLAFNGIKPMTCNTFESYRPEICARCPNRGMINSPISVPRRPRVVPIVATPVASPTEQGNDVEGLNSTEDDNAGSDNDGGDTFVDDGIKFEEIQTKNSRVNASGCWVRAMNAEGERYWNNIYPYPVYPLQRVRGRTAKGETTISYILRKYRHNGYDDIQMDGSTLMGQTLNAALGNYGFLLNEKERKLMAGLLIDILKETENTIGEVQTTNRLGWNDTYDTFLLGNKLYKTDGKVFEIAVAGKAKPFSDITIPQGSLELWKQIANVYNKEGLEWGQAVMASAFASPLMPLGALEKSALLFVTGDKGVGKSTALLLASSVYGNPERLMFNKMDTPNSRFHKLGIFSNITAAFDEMTDLSPKEASEFAYTLTQGRGKDKMGSGGEDMLINTTYWSCLPVMSANDSIISALSQHGLDPTAQMSRVLEVKATDINQFYTREEIENNERLVRQLPHNFGMAGDIYIKYITSHKKEVLNMIYEIEKRFRHYAGLNSNYRFWTYMCTRMIVGMMIACKLGLLNYNIAKLFVYLVKQVKLAKAEVEKYKWTPDNAVPQFLAAHLPQRLVVTHAVRPKDKPDNKDKGEVNDVGFVIQKPANGKEIVMRIELDTNNCIISIDAIRKWCSKSGLGYGAFMKLLEDNYTVVTNRTRRDLGKQTVYRDGGYINCIVINLPKDFPIQDS